MELSETDRAILTFLAGRYAANRSELSQAVGFVRLDDALARLRHNDLVAYAPELAQYHRPEDPPPIGVNRWLLTDEGREALEAED